MLYSGASMIKVNGQQQERFSNLRPMEPVRAVEPPQQQKSGLDDDTKDALLRFARFIHKEKKEDKKHAPDKKVPVASPAAHPYEKAFCQVAKSEICGQVLDIYA